MGVNNSVFFVTPCENIFSTQRHGGHRGCALLFGGVEIDGVLPMGLLRMGACTQDVVLVFFAG